MAVSKFEFNGGHVSYQMAGQGPPVVFIHGFSLDHRMWAPQLVEFAKTNTVVSYDLRGFGESSIPAAPYSHHEDLCELLNHLGVEKAYLVGLSLGGEVAIDFCLTYPKRVLSLTLLDTSLGGYESTVDWDVKAKTVGLEQAKLKWLNHPVFDYSNRSVETQKTLQELVSSYSGWHWLNDDPRLKLSPAAMTRIETIRVPLITAVGENDLDYYHKISEYIAARNSNSRQTRIPSAGHMSNLDNPEFVNDLIRENIGHAN